jgi:hypothetical protein
MTAALHVERGVHLADIGMDARDDINDRFSESYNPNAVLKQDNFDRLYEFGHMLQWALPNAAAAKAVQASESAIIETAGVAKTGLTNAQLVQKSATLAERAVAAKGPVAGTAKHEYASALLERYQSIYGTRGLSTKVYFNNGVNNRGFLDVLDRANGIIYDFKFGVARMSTEQHALYTRNFGLPIQVIRP